MTIGAAAIVGLTAITQPPTLVQALTVAPAAIAFVARGYVPRMPPELFAALVIVPVAVGVADDGALEGTFFLVNGTVLVTSWRTGSFGRSAVIAGVAVLAPWVVNATLEGPADFGWQAWSSASAFMFAMGRLLRRQDGLIQELGAARDELAVRAVAEERRRIARELHDLAGHTLAAVMLHVTGARHVLRRDVEEAERALRDAEAVGRASLDQIRVAVSLLRTDDERGTDPPLAVGGDIDALVDEYRRAGIGITAAITPPATALEGPVAVAVHRIAREALANVARHAPANAVELTVNGSPNEVRLVVRDHGTPPRVQGDISRHFGILGMQERARALGGELQVGPTDDGWRVEARLPVHAS